MFSKSCEYAIRAVIFICTKKEENKVVKIQEIAEAVGAPVYYTSKILQQLSRLKLTGRAPLNYKRAICWPVSQNWNVRHC
jgi:DNA-binding IscR family transcriptional regulator